MEFVKLEEVDSTNSWAKANIDKYEDLSCVYALRQTNGRGRLNRSWVDLGEGNIFASIILKPSDIYIENYSSLTQYFSVVLCKVLEGYKLKPQIKWPNDVLIDGKKIAGILSETVMEGLSLKGIILGFGINLKSTEEDLKNIPNKIATALNLELGREIEPQIILSKTIVEFWERYFDVIEKGFEIIKEDYIKRNCFIGKKINVQVLDKKYSGTAQGITDKGELILEQENNEKIVLTIGDINYE